MLGRSLCLLVSILEGLLDCSCEGSEDVIPFVCGYQDCEYIFALRMVWRLDSCMTATGFSTPFTAAAMNTHITQ